MKKNDREALLNQQFAKLREKKVQRTEVNDDEFPPTLPEVHRLYYPLKSKQRSQFAQFCVMRNPPSSPPPTVNQFVVSSVRLDEFVSKEVEP